MKESIVDWRQQHGSILHRNITLHHGPYKAVGPRCKHLCVVCALMKHDFEERAPDAASDDGDTLPLARALVDGLPYRSVYHVASRGIECTDCREKVLMTYDPEYMDEGGRNHAPCAFL